uniref:Response regulatory domain-containing protein n=1 Tax=Daucus carota subsp. sativus TaxID=79200 RepID=A0A162AAK9_DAUCS
MYRILVVDDDRTSLIVAAACLKRWNYQVTAVSHPLEALSILEQRDENEKSYDVVLSDVHMPDMDGFKLMRRVNKEFNLPVVCGNPNKILINQLLEQRRTGKWADPIQASHPLPPYNEAEASFSMSTSNAMLMSNDYASSSDNVATPTQGPGCVPFQGTVTVAGPVVGLGGTPFQSAGNVNMENISTYIHRIQHLNYKANHDQPGSYDQNPLVPQQYNLTNGGLIGGVNNITFSSTNHIVPYNQNPLVPQQYNLTNGGLIGGVNNITFPSTNHMVPSSGTTPIFDGLSSKQQSTVALQDMQTADMTQQARILHCI